MVLPDFGNHIARMVATDPSCAELKLVVPHSPAVELICINVNAPGAEFQLN